MSKKYIIVFCTLLFVQYGVAQQKKQQLLFENFLKVNDVFKALPIAFNIQMHARYNWSAKAVDTAAQQGRFVIGAHAMGCIINETEQVMNDSTVVMMNHTAKRMIVATSAKSPIEKMKQQLGNEFSKKNISSLQNQYHITHEVLAGNEAKFQLTAVKLLTQAAIPVTECTLLYNPTTMLPTTMVMKSRLVYPVPDAELAAWQEKIPNADTWVVKYQDKYYAIQERTITIQYSQWQAGVEATKVKSIDHYVVKNKDGTFESTPNYAAYIIERY